MEWLNYHHLYYFSVIAQEGSLSRAAAKLLLTHSTMSAQLRSLESFLGQDLFDRKGRRLVLTPFGAEVAHYATDIFQLGRELVDVARGRRVTRRARLTVGVVGTLPRTIVYRLLEPALVAQPHTALQVRQGRLEDLLALLAGNQLHVVLSDQPPEEGHSCRLRSELLGETEIHLYAVSGLARRYRRGFPGSLAEAPLLLPGRGSQLRRSMERWFADRGLEVHEVGDFDDAGLLRVFGAFGHGLFPVRSVLASEVEETRAVESVGALDGLRERYYAICLDRRSRDPRVAAVIEAGKGRLLAPRSKLSRPAGRGLKGEEGGRGAAPRAGGRPRRGSSPGRAR